MRPYRWIAALLAAAAAVPAFATTQASIHLSQLTASVVDLDAGDARRASFAWQGDWMLGTDIDTDTQAPWLLVGGPTGKLWTPQWNSVHESARSSPESPAFVYQANRHGGAVGAGTDGTVMLSTAQTVEAGEGGGAASWLLQSFTLGAGSAVTFAIVIDANAFGPAYAGDWTPAPDTGIAPGSHRSDGRSWAGLAVSGHGDALNASFILGGSGSWLNGQSAYQAPVQGGILELTVRNDSAFDRTYGFRLSAAAMAREALAPVPEPASYALMGAGVLAVGIVARRRRAAVTGRG